MIEVTRRRNRIKRVAFTTALAKTKHRAPSIRCDIEAVLPDGVTRPLHIACRRGHEKAATLLLDCNANHAAPGVDGHSALHMAAKEGKAAIVEVRTEVSPF